MADETETTTETEDQPPPAEPENQPTSEQPPEGQSPAEPEQPDQGQQHERAGDDLKAEARKWEHRSKSNKRERDEAVQARDQANATLEALRKALDPNSSQEEDPREVADRATKERDAKDQELRALRLERAAEKAAHKHGADPIALVDSRAFITELGKLDPADDGFTSDLNQLVTDTLEQSPRLKATQPAPARSVGDGNGHGNKTGQLSRADLATMTNDEITQARKDGRLASVMQGNN